MASQKDINNQKQLNSEYASARDILDEIQKSLGKQRDATKEAASEYRKLESIAQKLLLDEEQIVQLTDKQIQQNRDKAAAALAEIQVQAQRLMNEKGIVDIKHVQISMIHNLTDAQIELLSAAKDGYTIEKELIGEIEKELQLREKSNKLLGTSGAILKGINAVAGNFSKAFGLDEVEKKMSKTADEVVRMNKGFGKLRVAAAGAGEAFNQLGNNLLSPTVLLTSMVVGFNKVDKAATDFQQQTGQDMNTMSTSLQQFNGGLITSAEYIKTASDLTKEFGLNATAIFTPEDLSEAASMTKEMGLAGKESANLARLSKVNGGNIKAQNEDIVKGINSANKQNKTAVAHGQALRDVANVSEGIAINYAGYPDKLGKAAASARGLGMSLADVDGIAGSLLDFSTSIEAEMEAELLTGKQLNLEKARQFALDNDLVGVATELANQGITSTSYSKLNRIQQEAQAKALGMNREQMGKMLLQQEMNAGLTKDALSDAQKVTLEDLNRVDAQEKFATAIAKLQQALSPIVSIFATIASNWVVIYGFMGAAVGLKIWKNFDAMKGAFSAAKDGASALFKTMSTQGGLMDKVLGKSFKGGQFMTGGGQAKAGGERAGGLVGSLKDKLTGKEGDPVGNIADKTKGIKGDQGKGVKQFLTGLGDGLASIGAQFGKVVKGSFALGIAGLVFAGAFAIALRMIKDVDPIQMIAFAGSLSILGLTVALMGSIGGNIITGALALGIMALALIPAAYAFSLLAGVDIGAMIAFSIVLPLLALAAAGLGFIAPFIIAGAFALGVLGLAMIPLASSFSMLKDVDVASISNDLLLIANPEIISGLIGLGVGLLSASAGLILGSIGLTILGPALQSVAIGFEMLNGSNMVGIVSSLTELAVIAPDLYSVSGGLFAIAGGLGAIAIGGLLALPMIGALSSLGAVSEGLSSIFGGDNKKETKDEGSMKALEVKLDELIAVISAGGNIYIDGAKVGKTVALATSNLG